MKISSEPDIEKAAGLMLSMGAGSVLIKGGHFTSKIRSGKAKVTDLANGGATQLGVTGDNYAPCVDSGQNCANDVYAVSLAGVPPSAFLTWFQAQEACANSGKRLPTNAEWQVAASGSPDPGPDDHATTCTSDNPAGTTPTGSRSGCVSARGAS